MLTIHRPNIADAPAWCGYFFNQVPETDLLQAFQRNAEDYQKLVTSLPADAENFAYAPGKWPLKWVLIHLIDTERFYSYRAFCSSRQMDISLEFDPNQDHYARNANAPARSLGQVAEEFAAVRQCSILLFRSMTDAMLDFKDFPGKMVYTARSLGWMAVGHNIHHLNVIRNKYLHKPANA